MPRRGNVPKREVLPDPMYGSVLVTKLVNSVMLDGKKGVSQRNGKDSERELQFHDLVQSDEAGLSAG